MSSISAIREALRSVRRQPALVFAEIAWRWSFAAAAWLLIALTGFEYLGSLTVSQADLLFLRTRHPALVARALSDIFHSSGSRLAQATIIVVCGLFVFWIVTASIGGFITLRALLPNVSTRPAIYPQTNGASTFRSLLGLNFLRASLTFATVLASLGALVLTGLIAPVTSEDVGLVADLFMVMITIVWLLWSGLNWLLSLAPIFVFPSLRSFGGTSFGGSNYIPTKYGVRNYPGEDTFGSISAAVDLLHRFSPTLTGASALFAVVHGFAFVIAASVSVAVIGMMSRGSNRAGSLVLLIIALAYFAFVDFLHIARLATYAAISQSGPEASTAVLTPDLPLLSEPQPATW